MKYGLLFVNYNNSFYSKKLIESVFSDQQSANTPIIIVDNNSSEQSVRELREIAQKFGSVHVIYHTKNIGYFKGLNVGLSEIKKMFPEIVYWVVGNNDLLFPKTFSDQLKRVKPILDQYPVVSPDIRTLDGLPQNPAVIDSISKFRELIYDLNFSSFYLSRVIHWFADITNKFTDRADETYGCEIAQEIYQGYGACYILGPRFFEIFGELWAPSFLGYEEFFIAKQLEEKGFRTFYEPSINVIHQCKGSTGAKTNKFMWERFRESHKIYRKYVKVL